MKRIAAILALLLLLPLVSAELVVNKYTNDFTLSSPNNEQLKLCSCETRVDTIIVSNTGQFYSDYEIRVESDYPRSIRIGESGFSLAPKHSKEIPIYIEDSCGVQGTYRYLVTAVNTYGRIEQLERSIRSDACQVGLLDVTPENRTVGLCEPATFTVTAKNVGTYAETFSLDFGGYDVASDEMFLQPGQEYTQDVDFTWACTEHGDRTVPFTLVASRTGPQAYAERQVRIENEYGFTLGLATGAEACGRTTTTIPVTVTNDAPVEDEITLSLAGPGTFAGERGMTLTLGAGESRTADIEVADPAPGAQHITLTARDAYGGIEKTRTIALDVSTCYAPAAEIRLTPEEPLVGTDVDCCGPKTYYVNVRNDGDREQVFQLWLDGPSVFTLDELTVRVRPSENVNVPIRAELPCTDQAYEATVTVWPVGQPQVNASATLSVDSWSQRACYQVQIDEDELTVREDAEVVPVIVRHTGLRGGNYTITSESEVFGFREATVELQPGEEKAIHMEPSVDLVAQEKGRYLVFPSFTHDNGLAYNEFLGVKLRGMNWCERFLDWLFGLSLAGWTLCARVALALFVILIVLLVVLLLIYLGKLTFLKGGLTRRTLAVVKTALVALAILVLLLLAFLDAPPREAAFEREAMGNATVLEWYQNERLSVNLDQYFDDPDMDSLAYVASQPRDIDARIEGSWLTLTPDHNFAGENSMVITASDQKGGFADSPVFILRVIPRKELTFVQWLELWCHHVNALLLLAIIVVFLLMVLTVKERRQDLQRDNVIVVVSSEKKAKSSKRASTKRSSKRRVKKASTRSSSKKRPSRKRAAKKAPKKSSKTRTASTSAAAPRAISIAPSRTLAEPVRETRDGQTVNIAVGQPLAVPGARPNEILLVASKTGNTVHTPYCMIARRIPKNKRIAFGAKQDALRAGLVPCKGCRPF